MTKQLKKEQIDAINLNSNLIVPANAGSGKTFVMLQRVINFMVNKNLGIQDFLMITFSEAAASQMLSKLQAELLKKYYDSNLTPNQKKHIKNEFQKLPFADISTIDAFCYKLVKKYFYVVNVSSNCQICDEDLSDNLKEKAMQQTLNYYAQKNDEKFVELFSTYNTKRNFGVIKDIIYKMFDHIKNQVDSNWFENQIEKIYSDYEKTSVSNIINDYVVSIFSSYEKKLRDILTEATHLQCEPLKNAVEVILKDVEKINSKNSFLENHNLVFSRFNESFERIPKVDENAKELCDEFAELKSLLSKDIKEIKTKRYIHQDASVLKQDLIWCKNNVLMLFEIFKTFKKKYDDLKTARLLLDFSDLEHLAYQILCDEKVLDEIRRCYKQIFVDEYQDVNDIQEAIISKLFKDEQNTLFLVGDPKQSIYRFRNTNPQIMLDKLENFKNEKDKAEVPLFYNFRSDENILNFSNFIFSKLMTKQSADINYFEEGMFKPGISFLKSSLPNVEVCVINYEKQNDEKIVPQSIYSVKDANLQSEKDNVSARAEADFIASKISELISEKYEIFDVEQNKMRKVDFDDIAILYRARGPSLDATLKRLKELNIPIKSTSGENVFENYEIQVLVNYLKLLVNSNDDYSLVAFLSSPIINLSFDELSLIREKGTQKFCELIKEQTETNEKLKKAFDLIETGREKILNSSIYHVLNWLCETTSYKSLILSLPDSQEKLANVDAFLNDFLCHSYNNDLVGYLSYIKEQDNVSFKQTLGGEQKGISVLTMHQSKGLEFPICFVVNLSHEFNKKDLIGPALFSSKLGIGVERFDRENRFKTNTLARSAIYIDESKKSLAEELRVLYVGLTRAKNHLYVVGQAKIEKLKSDTSYLAIKKKNDYMSMILSCLSQTDINSIKLGKQTLHIKTGDKTSFKLNVITPEKIEKTEVKTHKIEPLDLDFDCVLNNAQNMSKKLKLENELSNIAFKSSVSRIMEKEDNRENNSISPKKFFVSENGFSAEQVGVIYHKVMEIIPFDLTTKEEIEEFLKENLESDEFKQVDCEKIKKCLDWLKPYLKDSQKVVREGQFYLNIEHNKIVPNSNIKEKVLIQGVVDLFIEKTDGIILIDYKTNREKDDDKMREKYKIQLDCYKIAVENARKKSVTHKILYSFFKDCEILFDK